MPEIRAENLGKDKNVVYFILNAQEPSLWTNGCSISDKSDSLLDLRTRSLRPVSFVGEVRASMIGFAALFDATRKSGALATTRIAL